MTVNLTGKYKLGLSGIYLNSTFLHASPAVVTHFLFYKDAPTCSRYPSYQHISPSSQKMPISAFGLNSTSDLQVLMGLLKIFLICKVMMDLESTNSLII